MATNLIGTANLYLALKAEGFELPANCADVELEMPVDGCFVLHYRVLLDDNTIAQIGRAFVRIAKNHLDATVPTGPTGPNMPTKNRASKCLLGVYEQTVRLYQASGVERHGEGLPGLMGPKGPTLDDPYPVWDETEAYLESIALMLKTIRERKYEDEKV